MQFNSVHFMFFFPIVVAVFFLIPAKWRQPWLLFASYYFYMSWNALYAVLILGSTVITFFSAKLISSYRKDKKKKIFIYTGIVLNLGILVVFKYGNFIIDILIHILCLFRASMAYRFSFVLPVGISFYTFQAIGYVIDVYRNDVEVERDFVKYALFVSFFPQLVAGPIERSNSLLGQMRKIESIKLWDAKRVTSGAIFMLWGFFLKMVIADRVALMADTVFSEYQMLGRTELILGALAFTIQIYCDFNSYSLIAIGASKVLGFDLMENFDTPYFSRSIREFWSRWHISLSTWFRDYLYIPLGGNRTGILKKQINTIIVFLVSGLWHGANWTFVVWGGIHGAYMVAGDLIRPLRNWIIDSLKIKTECFSWRLLERLTTFGLVMFAWVFFRAPSLKDSIGYFERIIKKPDPWVLFDGSIYKLGLDRLEISILLVALMVMIVVSSIKYNKKMNLDMFLMEQNVFFEWGVIATLFITVFVYGKYGIDFDPQSFIYFQF